MHKPPEEKYAFFASIVESSHDGIIGMDLKGLITSWNKGAQRIFGYKKNEVNGKKIDLLYIPGRIPKISKIQSILKSGRQIKHYETERVKKDGKKINISLTISPIRNKQGKLVGFSNTVRDITRDKYLEDQLNIKLLRSKNQLEAILAGVADGITVLDSAGKVIFANKSGADLLGYSDDESLLKAALKDILSRLEIFDEKGEKIPSFKFPASVALKTKKPYVKILRIKIKNNGEERYNKVKAVPVFDQYRKLQLIVNIFTDITDHIIKEKRKDEFLYIASHELRTPLTSMRVFAETLKRRIGVMNRKNIQAYLSKIEEHIDKISHLVDDFLDVGRIREGTFLLYPFILDLDSLLANVKEDIKNIVKTHHITFPDKTNIKLLADKERIEQVLINLLNNAVANSAMTRIITVSAVRKNGYVKIGVSNYGRGIPAHLQEKIFEPYFIRASKKKIKKTSLGLGLYIAREIIKLHGGRIWVENSQSKITTFYFTLPVA